ncbi:MAG: 1-(5-phosphoribosyl)-5-[(5-phosphoribosylamino)methylideneamino]imidazole-4-carboxamide isomerase [Planctomycetaceae bacterium]|nr:1-(5-phosphoribosyl)-5-[(5-phosphoribosylamino)methylideneamino]imidazole-4-carboxamide isomerase [Planctomycetaceae bacterium]
MQILPAIDLRDGKCVRLKQGDYNQETVYDSDPVAMAQRWADGGAERLHLVDLDGAREGKPFNHYVVEKICSKIDIPCQLGGGIRDRVAINSMLNNVGVDRVIAGTQALKQPAWFCEMVAEFPNQLVLGIDARDSMVATEGWLDVSKTPALELAENYKDLDVAAVVYTNIANDGMLQGVDQATIADMVRLTELGLPVIASGGVTTADDVHNLARVASEHPKLVGAIIGRALYEGTLSLSDALSASR